MQSICQVAARKVASAITSLVRAVGLTSLSATRTPRDKQTVRPPRTHHWRSIGTVAVLACAFLLPAFAAQAAGTTPSSIPTFTSSANPSTTGQSVTFTATVSGNGAGTPTGTVDFFDFGTGTDFGTVTLQTVGGQQQASVTHTFNAATTDTIFAFYSGDTTFQGTSASLSQMVVNGSPTTTTISSSSNPSTVNQSVTFTATVTSNSGTGTPSGTVTFFDQGNGKTLGTVTLAPVGGQQQASVTTSFTGVTTDTILATYNGDGTFATSSGQLSQMVVAGTPTMTALTSSANPSAAGQSVTFTATVTSSSGTPTGTVMFFDQGTGTNLGTFMLQNVGGAQKASVTTSFAAATTDTITATYSGDATFAGSSGQLIQSVTNGTPTTTTIASSQNPSTVGQNVIFTATVAPTGGSGTPTGQVTFSVDGGAGTTMTLSGGKAMFSTATLTATNHTITASYAGDGTFAASTGTFTQNVVNGTPTTTTLGSSQNPSAFGQSVTFTATVTATSGTPAGSVVFTDMTTSTALGTVTLGSGATASVSVSTLTIGSHSISATYNGNGTFAPSNGTFSQTVATGTTTVTLTSSQNPSAPNQAVTFTAAVKVATGSGTPTGTVIFKDNGTPIGNGTLGPVGGVQTASFTTTALTNGSHQIIAVYSGDANFGGNMSATLVQNVGTSSDSTKLRQMQVSTTPVIAAAWGATTSSAMDDAVSAGFGGNPQSLSPSGTGFTYYFNDDAPAQPKDASEDESLRRYLASPTGSLTSPNGSTVSPNGSANAAAADSVKRVDDDFNALGYAGRMVTKAPPPAAAGAPREWLAWINVRGTDYFRGTFGDDLKGDQEDVLAGLTRRISPNFVVGAFGGYEHFHYSSQAFNSVLKGDGWTVGAYLGWKLAPNIRFDAGGAWSDIRANDTAGTAIGNFTGTRWLINGGLTGTYPWQMLILEPSARVFAIWEHENAFTDSLGTLQAARNFETGRASVGTKAIYPFAWTSSTVALSPYAGLYADYYFSRDDAQTAGLTTVPLLQGFSARVTGGVAASFAGGATLGAGGEFGGIGSATHIWTWTARGRIPF